MHAAGEKEGQAGRQKRGRLGGSHWILRLFLWSFPLSMDVLWGNTKLKEGGKISHADKRHSTWRAPFLAAAAAGVRVCVWRFLYSHLHT
jgi:hypothetical protein